MSDQRRGAREEIDAVARRIEAIRAAGTAASGARRPVAARSTTPTVARADAAAPAAPGAPDRVAAQIDAIAVRRGPRRRDLSIAALVGAARDGAARTQRRLGELIELWEQVVPGELLPHTTLGALRGGVLHVHVDSSAVAYELDRLLREGLTAELRRRSRTTLSRVRITQAAPITERRAPRA